MATIHIDGKDFEVNGADNLLQACLSLGLDVPYFCWHPALGSVGACRQCAVKQYQNADDKRGRLVMSCMTPATDGTYISIEDEEAKAFRKSVVEWLMLNHPHDCPVCEEGGACHLQDMTVMTGHNTRRYRFTKRTHKNQYLGPFIAHEMNRCIACYRCVRYYKDYADGTDLGVYGAHDNVYFGRVEDGALESEFSGNLIEICPTGVFTDQTHSQRYNRKWDMQFAPSICQHCSVGCNISPGERYGELRRIENRYNGAVNHYFLCDRGRFGYGFVNAKDRPVQAQLNTGEGFVTLSQEHALNLAADTLRHAKQVIGIGSARASVESNFALRSLVGEHNFYAAVDEAEWQRQQLILDILNTANIELPSLRDIEEYDAVLVLGEDITQTAPRIALAVRQAAKGKAREMAAALRVDSWQTAAIQNIGQHARHPVMITALAPTRLDDIASVTWFAHPEQQAELAFNVAECIQGTGHESVGSESTTDVAQQIASYLLQAKKPLIISGSSASSEALLKAAANIALALKARQSAVGLSLVVPDVNSLGLVMLGAQPLQPALAHLAQVDVAIVMEADLYRHASAASVSHALSSVPHLIVLDHQHTATTDKATLLLPAASFAEADGTVINHEGRAQRFYQVYAPSYYAENNHVAESWQWLTALQSHTATRQSEWTHFDVVSKQCAQTIPALANLTAVAPKADFRIRSLKLARSPHRYSGRTALRANISVHEPRVPQDVDTPFAFSMEGYSGSKELYPDIPFVWSPGWNSPQAWNKYQDKVGGRLKAGDPGLRLITPQVHEPAHLYPYPHQKVEVVAEGQGYQVVGQYHIFGSEELSQRAGVIQSRTPAATIGISEADAQKLAVNEGTLLSFSWDKNYFRLPVRIDKYLMAGVVALPVGFAGIPLGLLGQVITDMQEAVL
nr:NADH-quinone oxidoreductase subunit NuoG [Plesiomonas shigelloides]